MCAEIRTTPSGLETTSLVFAYGIDLFYTRVTPSGTFDILKDDFDLLFLLDLSTLLFNGSKFEYDSDCARTHSLTHALAQSPAVFTNWTETLNSNNNNLVLTMETLFFCCATQ
uniref:ER membrane protein complex subunit 1 n=1 Tax=Globodera rostochiensis TaxID=31243 RepID=A0A914HS65_GLORO